MTSVSCYNFLMKALKNFYEPRRNQPNGSSSFLRTKMAPVFFFGTILNRKKNHLPTSKFFGGIKTWVFQGEGLEISKWWNRGPWGWDFQGPFSGFHPLDPRHSLSAHTQSWKPSHLVHRGVFFGGLYVCLCIFSYIYIYIYLYYLHIYIYIFIVCGYIFVWINQSLCIYIYTCNCSV